MSSFQKFFATSSPSTTSGNVPGPIDVSSNHFSLTSKYSSTNLCVLDLSTPLHHVVIPTTLFEAKQEYIAGNQIVENQVYKCYVISQKNIRVINQQDNAIRSLLKYHDYRICDLLLHSNKDKTLLVSVDVSGKIIITLLSNTATPSGIACEQIAEIILKRSNTSAPLDSKKAEQFYLRWHPSFPSRLLFSSSTSVFLLDLHSYGLPSSLFGLPSEGDEEEPLGDSVKSVELDESDAAIDLTKFLSQEDDMSVSSDSDPFVSASVDAIAIQDIDIASRETAKGGSFPSTVTCPFAEDDEDGVAGRGHRSSIGLDDSSQAAQHQVPGWDVGDSIVSIAIKSKIFLFVSQSDDASKFRLYSVVSNRNHTRHDILQARLLRSVKAQSGVRLALVYVTSNPTEVYLVSLPFDEETGNLALVEEGMAESDSDLEGVRAKLRHPASSFLHNHHLRTHTLSLPRGVGGIGPQIPLSTPTPRLRLSAMPMHLASDFGSVFPSRDFAVCLSDITSNSLLLLQVAAPKHSNELWRFAHACSVATPAPVLGHVLSAPIVSFYANKNTKPGVDVFTLMTNGLQTLNFPLQHLVEDHLPGPSSSSIIAPTSTSSVNEASTPVRASTLSTGLGSAAGNSPTSQSLLSPSILKRPQPSPIAASSPHLPAVPAFLPSDSKSSVLSDSSASSMSTLASPSGSMSQSAKKQPAVSVLPPTPSSASKPPVSILKRITPSHSNSSSSSTSETHPVPSHPVSSSSSPQPSVLPRSTSPVDIQLRRDDLNVLLQNQTSEIEALLHSVVAKESARLVQSKEELLQVLEQSLSSITSELLDAIMSTLRTNLLQTLNSSFEDSVASAATNAASVVDSHIHSLLENKLPEVISSIVSRSINAQMEEVGEQVIKPATAQAFKTAFLEICVPAFERGVNEMKSQVEASLLLEVGKERDELKMQVNMLKEQVAALSAMNANMSKNHAEVLSAIASLRAVQAPAPGSQTGVTVAAPSSAPSQAHVQVQTHVQTHATTEDRSGFSKLMEAVSTSSSRPSSSPIPTGTAGSAPVPQESSLAKLFNQARAAAGSPEKKDPAPLVVPEVVVKPVVQAVPQVSEVEFELPHEVTDFLRQGKIEDAFSTTLELQSIELTLQLLHECKKEKESTSAIISKLSLPLLLCLLQQLGMMTYEPDSPTCTLQLDWLEAVAIAMGSSKGSPEWESVSEHLALVSPSAIQTLNSFGEVMMQPNMDSASQTKGRRCLRISKMIQRL
jgi:hypothetical protein